MKYVHIYMPCRTNLSSLEIAKLYRCPLCLLFNIFVLKFIQINISGFNYLHTFFILAKTIGLLNSWSYYTFLQPFGYMFLDPSLV